MYRVHGHTQPPLQIMNKNKTKNIANTNKDFAISLTLGFRGVIRPVVIRENVHKIIRFRQTRTKHLYWTLQNCSTTSTYQNNQHNDTMQTTHNDQ